LPEVQGANFGISVDLSRDGTTLAVGADGNLTTGAAFIYTVSGGVWTQQQRIVGPYITSFYGYTVSLSSNGSTLVVGSKTNVYVYNKISGVYTGAALSLPGDLVNINSYDLSLLQTSISGDGNTLIVNNSTNNNSNDNGIGAFWTFTQGPIGTWRQHGNALYGRGGQLSNGTRANLLCFSGNGSKAVLGTRSATAPGATGATGGI